MEKLNIEFTHGSSFIGTSYSMKINNKDYDFGLDKEDNVKDKIVNILKNEYGYNINKKDIDFKWDGTM